MSWCDRGRIAPRGKTADRVGIKVRRSAEYGSRAVFTNLESCKSLSCPVCCGYRRERIGEKLGDAAERWDKAGNSALYVVLSVSHGITDKLADLHAAESVMWRRITASRAWKELRADTGLEYLRTDEVTIGRENGYHPHINLYLPAPTQDTGEYMVKVYIVLNRLWKRECARFGLSAGCGVHVEEVRSGRNVGEYVCKEFGIGREMTRGDLKQGRNDSRTFLQVVADYRSEPSDADLQVIQEYMLAIRGRRMLNASRGFWQLMATADIDEVSEDEVAGGEDDSEQVEEIGYLQAEVWDRLVRIWELPAELLSAAETGGRDAVVRLLARHGASLIEPSSRWLAGEAFSSARAAQVTWKRHCADCVTCARWKQSRGRGLGPCTAGSRLWLAHESARRELADSIALDKLPAPGQGALF